RRYAPHRQVHKYRGDYLLAPAMRDRDCAKRTGPALQQLQARAALLVRIRRGHDDIRIESGCARELQRKIAECNCSGAYRLDNDGLRQRYDHNIAEVEIAVLRV